MSVRRFVNKSEPRKRTVRHCVGPRSRGSFEGRKLPSRFIKASYFRHGTTSFGFFFVLLLLLHFSLRPPPPSSFSFFASFRRINSCEADETNPLSRRARPRFPRASSGVSIDRSPRLDRDLIEQLGKIYLTRHFLTVSYGLLSRFLVYVGKRENQLGGGGRLPTGDNFSNPVNNNLINSLTSHSNRYVITELLQSDLHKIIVSPQHLSPDHIKVFLYQILRGE